MGKPKANRRIEKPRAKGESPVRTGMARDAAAVVLMTDAHGARMIR